MYDDYRQEMSDVDPREMPAVQVGKLEPEEQENIRTQSAQVVTDFLQMIRNQFYPDDRDGFYASRIELMRIITMPARLLFKKGVFIDDTLNRKILNTVLTGIKRHCRQEHIEQFRFYFKTAMQKHLQYNEERYIAEGKDVRDGRAKRAAGDILAKLQNTVVETPEQYTNALTNLAHLIPVKRAKSPQKKASPKPEKSDNQLDLL